MAIEVIEITQNNIRDIAPLWNSPSNQIRRAIGRNVKVYAGDRCGTVRSIHDGSHWDYWLLDDGTVKIIPAA